MDIKESFAANFFSENKKYYQDITTKVSIQVRQNNVIDLQSVHTMF